MENSENKSLISTRSLKLTKKEKLLSITQKIVSEIKPQYESERIGDQEWITRNLDVARFRNGDLIPHIESDEEWEEYGKNGQPAWCYYDNDPENGKSTENFIIGLPSMIQEDWYLKGITFQQMRNGLFL